MHANIDNVFSKYRHGKWSAFEKLGATLTLCKHFEQHFSMFSAIITELLVNQSIQ